MEWEHKYAKMGMRMVRVHVKYNGNGYFLMCAKSPIGRLDANAIQ